MNPILQIRPAQIEDTRGIALVHVDTWTSTYASVVPDEYLANLQYELSQSNWSGYLSDTQSE